MALSTYVLAVVTQNITQVGIVKLFFVLLATTRHLHLSATCALVTIINILLNQNFAPVALVIEATRKKFLKLVITKHAFAVRR